MPSSSSSSLLRQNAFGDAHARSPPRAKYVHVHGTLRKRRGGGGAKALASSNVSPGEKDGRVCVPPASSSSFTQRRRGNVNTNLASARGDSWWRTQARSSHTHAFFLFFSLHLYIHHPSRLVGTAACFGPRNLFQEIGTNQPNHATVAASPSPASPPAAGPPPPPLLLLPPPPLPAPHCRSSSCARRSSRTTEWSTGSVGNNRERE